MAPSDRRPTIIDVARKAGVSKSTVSLVIQNSPLVKQKTREQVQAAMTEIGYVYNRAAANLRSAGAGLVGLVINDLRNPFFTEFATSVQMALSSRGYAAVVANTDEDPQLQAQVVEAMIEHGVSAMILSPAYGDEALSFEALQRAGIPAMQVLRKVEMRTELFPFAAPDYPNGTRIATEHLLEQGAKRIAFVGGLEGRAVTQERMAGYLSAIEMAGLEPHVLTGSASRAFGRQAAHELADDHPEVDGAVCFNDQVALGMISGCAEIGRNVGRDLRIVGFDDIEEAAHSWPPLSSVRCDIDGFGKLVAETILAWLENDKVPAPEIRTPVSLAIRGSSGETPAG
ncbi:LacI family transcriptional regulator [Thioclava sp. ES.031]|uniref:LacI family DNA-binding transcriptional regulator n=1 Tax=Thioclava sp. ES.031 TaxID=1798203 RepID=UPI000BF8EF48|nr:LacI family DNA-binding transcriptional regulator [Thioclava sp. ES.031]PFG65110.1 LacI family transcriptional regulator [Thioclava sp. ES.031]